jgi:hypothetical protein
VFADEFAAASVAVAAAAPVAAAVGADWLLMDVAEVVELALDPVVSDAAEADGPVLLPVPPEQVLEISVTLLTCRVFDEPAPADPAVASDGLVPGEAELGF